MAAASGLLIVFVLAVTVGGGLLLYALVRQEHDQRQAMDRQAAERVARRDTGDGPVRRDAGTDRTASEDRDAGNHWGDSSETDDGDSWDAPDDDRWGDRQ